MATTSSQKNVLITGGNGAIGFPVVLHTLRAGHSVHAVVRTQAKADLISNSKSVQSLPASIRSKLSFSLVPDLSVPTAYDDVLSANKNIDHIIHVASPIPTGGKLTTPAEFDELMIQPAIQGTLNILNAAERAGIKRVVITSSVVGQIPIAEFGVEGNETVYNEHSRAEDPAGPFTNESDAYRASKILALNATERWVKENGGKKTEVVHVHPSIVLGRVELVNSIEEYNGGSAGWAVKMILGKEKFPRPMVSNTVWLEDIAEVHVRALDETRVPNGQSLVAQGGGINGSVWANGKAAVEKAFPKAVESGVLPNDGWADTTLLKYDVSETERLVGMKFVGLDKQVVEIAGQYLDLIGEERA